MKAVDKELFNKVENVAKTVLNDLRKKGYVVPTKIDNNVIDFDGFKVGKDIENTYYIVNQRYDITIRYINLPQTAALLANRLALGKGVDNTILNDDRTYGFRQFDMQRYKQSMSKVKKDFDQFTVFETRYQMAESQAKNCKRRITDAFEKLRRLR